MSSILHFYYHHLLVFCIILFYYLVKKLQNTRNFVKLMLIAFFIILFTSYVDPNSIILIIKQTCHLCIMAHVIMYVSFLLHVGDQMNEIVTNVTALSSWISSNVNVQLPLLVGIVTVLSSCIAFSNCRG